MKKSQNMLSGPLLPSIISYTVPIIITSILQLLFNAADMVIVGRFCGSVSVAAVGSTTSLIHLIINLFVGLSVGAGVNVAHGIGRGDKDDVHRTVHTAMPTAIIGGVILTFVGIAFSETFLKFMGTPKDVLELSAIYMKIYFAGITFTCIYNFCAAILRAVGDTKSPLIFLTISGVINVVLNVLFVTVIDMNVAGVALATTISQAVSAVLVVFALMRRTDDTKLILGKMRIYKKQLLAMMRIGIPSGIQGSLFSISNVIIQSSVNSFGSVVMSGNAASANIEGFVYVCLNAFHQTAVNFVGQNTGAKQFKRVLRVVIMCLCCVSIVGIVAGSLVCAFGRNLLSIYITDSSEAVSYGLIRLYFICLPYFICGLMDVTTGVLRGIGASVTPMIISVLGVCGIRLAWIFTIFQTERFHTTKSLYAAYTISWTVTFIIELIAFFIIYRKRVRKYGEKQ